MAIKLIRFLLAIALVGGLVLAGSRIYRLLPPDIADNAPPPIEPNNGVDLTVVLSEGLGAYDHQKVEAYKIDYAAIQREYTLGPRSPGSFDDFLNRRLRGLEPAQGRFDNKGRVILKVSQGAWWIRASVELPSGEHLEWRIPVNIATVGQSVELTENNIYERTKKF